MKRIFYLMMLAVWVIAMPSCGEKNDPDEPNEEPNEVPVNSGGIPTEDGIVQTSGMVDLGLSVKWAARDLAASTSDNFASSCTSWGLKFYGLAKSFSGPLPVSVAGTSYDVATERLGPGWSTPTIEQFEELISNCRFNYIVYEEGIGLVITGKTGNAIFMNDDTEYWTSSVSPNDSYKLRSLYFDEKGKPHWNSLSPRSEQWFIRPVHN